MADFLDIEPFSEFAWQELADCPLAEPGVCMNPDCSRAFTPSRPWAMYCCRACSRAGEAEFRVVGNKAAAALLAWRSHRYAKADAEPHRKALASAAWRYVSRLQSEWFDSRSRRKDAAIAARKGDCDDG